MLDHFKLDGPNGTHSCIVLELLGPSVPDLLDARFRGERFPGKLAKNIATHALLGLDYLHQYKIGHGGELTILKFLADFSFMSDLHTRNLAFTIRSIHSLGEEEFFQKLGNPETGLIRRKDGKPLESGMPKYLVRPTSYPAGLSVLSYPIKIVDFGESFLDNEIPDKLHTPLPVRAPEIIFGEKFDYRVDLWSMGCMVSSDLERNISRQTRITSAANLNESSQFSLAF
jgi:serine/threonine protein kinase